jgi:selenocysteine-specific elongation factor
LPATEPLTLGTAGHIDHGKTALVAALTGVDTDRLPQEKARGISIELGYAPLELPSGRRLSVVDVPGHERFVRTMVAGATGIDLFLLVVACDDGVMPQTREHAAILSLLGLERGVVALTKRDLIDDEVAALVREEAQQLVPGAAVVEVSATTGVGLDELRAALDDLAASVPGRSPDGDVRLPIDRAFTLRGIGTVITGTLWSGTVHAGDRLSAEPGGLRLRVRSVEVHDRPVDAAAAGQRVALAVTGVERRQVGRGQTVLRPGSLLPSYRLECEIAVLPSAPHALRQGERVTVHHATAEIPARIAVRGAAGIEPGEKGRAQLRLDERAVAAAGDRIVVRLTSPKVTAAGGVVLDPAPPRSGERPVAIAPPKPAPPPATEAPPGADALLTRLRAAGLRPAPLGETDLRAASHLAAQGLIVRAGRDLAFAREAYEQGRDAVLRLALVRETVTLAEVRDALGISRRLAQALLEALDADGLTRRTGDERRLRREGRELAQRTGG